mgnify:CR=1 FL=1
MDVEEVNIIQRLQKKYLKPPKTQIEIKNPDLYQRINTFVTVRNQNVYQRINVFINILFEFYRVISCSLLILFIPQQCENNNVCYIKDKLKWNSTFYGVALIYNFITLLVFFFLYFLEMRRENVLIKYLDVNSELSYSGTDIEKLLDYIPKETKEKILEVHMNYKKYANILIYVYTINAILSGFIINKYKIPNQTISTFVTYILFILIEMITRKKVSDKVLYYANNVGLFIVLALMIYANLDWTRQ